MRFTSKRQRVAAAARVNIFGGGLQEPRCLARNVEKERLDVQRHLHHTVPGFPAILCSLTVQYFPYILTPNASLGSPLLDLSILVFCSSAIHFLPNTKTWRIPHTRPVCILDGPNCCVFARPLTYCAESSDSDEHFSDAHSGLGNSGSTTPVRPLTQVEKNAPEQSSSEDPGAKVYNSQNGNEGLAERAVIPEPRHLGIGAGGIESSEGPDPTTGVEKQKQDTTPSHQTETPGTVADQQRPEDTVPGTVGGDSKGDSSSGVVTPIPKIESSERTDELDLTEEAKDAPGIVDQRFYNPEAY